MKKFVSQLAIVCAALLFLSQENEARAEDGASNSVSDCSDQSISEAGIQHITEDDAASICRIALRGLHFDLTTTDLQSLVDASVIAQITARKRDFDLPAITAAKYLVALVDLRGLSSNQAGFSHTIKVAYKVDVGTDGVVSPGVLLAQLHASGGFAKTMSDDGLIDFAAMVSLDEKSKVAATSFKAQQPVSVDLSGPWRVIGHVAAGGHAISCSMSRGANEGGEFSYAVLISGFSEMNVQTVFSVDTELPEGTHSIVSVAFDKSKPIRLDAVVRGGKLILSLPSKPALLKDVLNRLQQSANLRLEPVGKPKAAATISLADAAAAFDQNGLCAKDALARGISEMKAASQQ